MELKDDPVEGVEVLLEYLYTLGRPKFDGNVSEAEHAFILGDKYGLTQLRSFGRDKMIADIQSNFTNWNTKADIENQHIINRIRQIWSWEQEGSSLIRECCLQQLSKMPDSLLDDPRFIDLVCENKHFAKEFIKYIFVMKNASQARLRQNGLRKY